MANKISKDMMIADIISAHPYLSEYIMDYGVHCIGCGANEFESLEEGFMGHGMSEEEIDEVIEKLNEVIVENNDIKSDMNAEKEFSITEKAANMIKRLGEKEKKETFRIKADFKEGKNTYKFIFDNKIDSNDTLFEDEGIKVIIDKETLMSFTNTVLDYKNGDFSLEHA